MKLYPEYEERCFVCNRKCYDSNNKRIGDLETEVEEIEKSEKEAERKKEIEDKKVLAHAIQSNIRKYHEESRQVKQLVTHFETIATTVITRQGRGISQIIAQTLNTTRVRENFSFGKNAKPIKKNNIDFNDPQQVQEAEAAAAATSAEQRAMKSTGAASSNEAAEIEDIR